jgi:hypothetical protein
MNTRSHAIRLSLLIVTCSAAIAIPGTALTQSPASGVSLRALATAHDGDASARRDAFVSALLKRLASIVDEGALDDPNALSKLLEVKLTISSKSDEDFSKECASSPSRNIRRSGSRIYAISGDSWLAETQYGRKDYRVPGGGVNGPYTVGQHAAFSYNTLRTVTCGDPQPPAEWFIDSNLEVGQLPALVCLSPADITNRIPSAKFQMATDGISMLVYQGTRGDVAYGSLQFDYQFASECSVGISLRSYHKVPVAKLSDLSEN